MRWLYHVRVRAPVTDGYVGPSFAKEGFTHCSYADRILESASLYFEDRDELELLMIDPRGLDVRVATTPRGPMPHVHEPIPAAAVQRVIPLPTEDPLADTLA